MALGVLLVVAAAGVADRDGHVAGAAEPRSAVTFIGDSTMAGMGPSARAYVQNRYDLTFEAVSCRRLIIPSCGRTVQHPNTLDVMRTLEGRLGDAVVVMAGYDDWQIEDAVDVIMGEAERQHVPLVLWVTYRTGVVYTGPGGVSNDATFRQFNDVLRAKQAEHPSLRLADWDAHARGRSTWFSPDGIHLTAEGATALATFLVAELDTLPVGRCRADRAVTGSASDSPAVAPAPAAPGGFTAAAPQRLADTRSDAPVGAGRVLSVAVGGSGPVPVDASGALVNITAVDACAPGFLTAFPCGASVPLASTLNYVTGETRANLATVQLGSDAELCVYSSARADVVVDLVGWFAPDGGRAIAPAAHHRLLDTRASGPRPTAQSWTEVAAPAGLAWVTLTVTEPAGAGFASVAPVSASGDCEGEVAASTLNYRRAQTVANVAAVATGSGGRICVFTWAEAHIVVDLIGTEGEGSGLVSPIVPVRVLDTRSSAPGSGVAPGGVVVVDPALGASTRALILNVTAAEAGAAGFVTAFPAAADGSCDASQAPLASSLNPAPGPPVASMVVVPTGGSGRACLTSSSAVDLVVDLTGVVESP